MERPIEEQQTLCALTDFAIKSAIPVLYDDPKGVDQLGTGTLFTIDGRYFLIPAGHVFDAPDLLNPAPDPGRFAIPKCPVNGDIHTLGPYKLYRATNATGDADVDMAILELKDSKTIEYAKTGGQILTLKDTSPASAAGVFVLCGYPSERGWRSETSIGGRPTTVFTERILEPPASATQPVHPALDLFFRYDVDGPNFNGEMSATPHLRGASGASIWEYREVPPGALWTPSDTMKVVGIQCSFREGSYFRGKSWRMVLTLLRQIDDPLTAAIDSYLAATGGSLNPWD